MTFTPTKESLERLYAKYNHRRFVSPDPLQFLYAYDNLVDREIAGMIASCLAFGTVKQIVGKVASVLERMPEPARFIDEITPRLLRKTVEGFRYRFVGEAELAALLTGMKHIMDRHGSLGACFGRHLREEHDTVLPALTAFVRELRGNGGRPRNYLLPSPEDGSACKRLNLFLRWMVRKDAVDPGGWEHVPPSKLVVPLDTHMHRIARHLGLTKRAQADMRTALEVTAGFRGLNAQDPVRYDFALTRLGIRRDPDLFGFLRSCEWAHAAHERRDVD